MENLVHQPWTNSNHYRKWTLAPLLQMLYCYVTLSCKLYFIRLCRFPASCPSPSSISAILHLYRLGRYSVAWQWAMQKIFMFRVLSGRYVRFDRQINVVDCFLQFVLGSHARFRLPCISALLSLRVPSHSHLNPVLTVVPFGRSSVTFLVGAPDRAWYIWVWFLL